MQQRDTKMVTTTTSQLKLHGRCTIRHWLFDQSSQGKTNYQNKNCDIIAKLWHRRRHTVLSDNHLKLSDSQYSVVIIIKKFKKIPRQKSFQASLLLSKNDIATSLLISFGIFGVSIGVIGVSNFSVNLIFFVITLIISLGLFALYKPYKKRKYSKKGYGR